MSEREAVLLVGFGRRGRQWSDALARLRGTRVAGVVDPDDAAREAAATQGLAAWARLDDALGEVPAGAAIVASPPDDHAVGAGQCLEAGLHVLVEKPMATSVAAATDMADRAERLGRRLVVGQNFRLHPREQIVGRVLTRDALGHLTQSVTLVVRPRATRPPGGPVALVWDVAVHHLDVVCHRQCGPPLDVEARAGDDGVRIQAAWAGGFALDYRLRTAGSVFAHLEWLEGEGGGVRVDDQRVVLVTPHSRPRQWSLARRPWRAEPVLARALLDGGPVADAFGGRRNLATVAAAEAAVASLRTAHGR